VLVNNIPISAGARQCAVIYTYRFPIFLWSPKQRCLWTHSGYNSD